MTDDDKRDGKKSTADLINNIQTQYDKINDEFIARSELSKTTAATSNEVKRTSLAASELGECGLMGASAKDKDTKKSE